MFKTSITKFCTHITKLQPSRCGGGGGRGKGEGGRGEGGGDDEVVIMWMGI